MIFPENQLTIDFAFPLVLISFGGSITESSTDPPAIPPANLVGDAFGKRRPVGRCGGGSVTAGTTGCGWVG